MMRGKYNITQCRLYMCRSKKRLAECLQVELHELHQLSKSPRYSIFQKNKRDITAPQKRLKRIQRRILQLLSNVERPKWVISSQKGKSYIDNGLTHVNSSYLTTMDIKKFYDNCQREYVYRFYIDHLKTAPDVAEILTNLTIYQGKIPTGSPSSQIIAYYAYMNMFNDLQNVALKYDCIFTLYVDDMTFSSTKKYDRKALCRDVNNLLARYEHRSKTKKNKHYGKSEHKSVTGTNITSDNKLTTPNRLRKKIVDTTKELKRQVKEQATLNPADIRSLAGQLQAASNIEAGIYPEIRRFIKEQNEFHRKCRDQSSSVDSANPRDMSYDSNEQIKA